MGKIDFSKIVSHIYETDREIPGSVFDTKCLETMYIELLECHNISHVTRFAYRLPSQVEHLEKRTVGRKVGLYFKNRFDSVLLDKAVEPDNFMRSMRDVV